MSSGIFLVVQDVPFVLTRTLLESSAINTNLPLPKVPSTQLAENGKLFVVQVSPSNDILY